MRRWVKAGLVVLAVAAAGWWGGHWLYWRWVDSLPRGPAAPVGAIAWIKEVPGKQPLVVIDDCPGGKRLYQTESTAKEARECSWSPNGRVLMVHGWDDRSTIVEFFRPFQPQAKPLVLRLPRETPLPPQSGVDRTYFIGWCDPETAVIGSEAREIQGSSTSGASSGWLRKALERVFPHRHPYPVELTVKTFWVFPRLSHRSSTRIHLAFLREVKARQGVILIGGDAGEPLRPYICRLSPAGDMLEEGGKWVGEAVGGGQVYLWSVDPKPGAPQVLAAGFQVPSPVSLTACAVGVVDLRNRTWTPLLSTGRVADRLTWSSDGEKLAVAHMRGGPPAQDAWEIEVVDLKGRFVAKGAWPLPHFPRAGWSPDGTRLAVRLRTQVSPQRWEGQILEIVGDGTFRTVYVEPDARAVDWFQGAREAVGNRGQVMVDGRP